MAAQTDSYTNLISLIEALAGTELEDTEKSRLQHLINRRAFKAYRATQYWPGFLTVGEERPVHMTGTSSIYPGTTEAAGNLFEVPPQVDDVEDRDGWGQVDTMLRIHGKRPWDQKGATEYEFIRVPSRTQYWVYDDNSSARNTAVTHPEGCQIIGFRTESWQQLQAAPYSASVDTAGAGTVNVYFPDAATSGLRQGDEIKLADFDTVSGVDINGTHTVESISTSLSQTNILLATDFGTQAGTVSWADGECGTIDRPVAYCTYKKRLTDTYGENDTTTIPLEWFEYMAHGAYADFLRADGQTEKAMGEEGFAKQILQDELERIEAQHYASTIGKRIQTHTSRAARFSSVR